MYKPKSLLAILVTSLVLAVVVFTGPSRAASVAPDPQARAAQLAQTTSSVHERIDRLTRRASAAHRGALMHKRVVRTDWRAIHVTRAVNGLNRLVLSMDAVDGGTYSALRGLNAQVLHLDRDARRLSRTALPKYGRSMCRRISALAGQLRVLDGRVKDRREEPPRPPQPPDPPTPTPTPTPTPSVIPTPTPTPTGIPAGAFNVMDYGAVADGVTDDAAAVQRAVDACHAAGGGTVYMPAGTYFFHAYTVLGGTTWDEHGVNLTGPGRMGVNVNVKSGVHVSGTGPAQTFVTGDVYAGSFGAFTQTYVGISNMDITTTYGEGGGGVDGSKWGYCNNVVLDNIVAHGLYIGLATYGCRDSLISNSIAYDIGSGCAGFVIGDAGEDVQDSDNVRVTNCEAYSGAGTGFRLQGQPPGSSYVSRLNNVYMTDCYAHDINSAWRTFYASNLTFLRCVGEDSPYPTNNMCLMNVATAHLTDCTVAHKATSASDNDWWVMYGSEGCTNITED